MEQKVTKISVAALEKAHEIAALAEKHPEHPIIGRLTSAPKVLDAAVWALFRKLKRTNPALMEEMPC
jgi:hypothetical protein